MSTVIEKLILSQLARYLTANGLFPKFQSDSADIIPQRQPYSRVLSDIYSAIDQDQVSLLALLDVSAAFDTVDHGILLELLSTSLHTDSLVWRTHGWSHTSLAENILFTLATATHLHPRLSVAFLRDQY